MAKALLGYVGSGGLRAQDQTRALRRRVRELEAQVEALQAEAMQTEAPQADALTAEEKALLPAPRPELLALREPASDYQLA